MWWKVRVADEMIIDEDSGGDKTIHIIHDWFVPSFILFEKPVIWKRERRYIDENFVKHKFIVVFIFKGKCILNRALVC